MPDVQGRSRSFAARPRQRSARPPDIAELEELRVRYLGRKAELTGILRGIAELPPEERGPVGAAGNEAGSPWRSCWPRDGPSSRPSSWSSDWPPTRST